MNGLAETPSSPTATETVLGVPVAEPPASDRESLHALTGLRIFAALAVYAHHMPPPMGAPAEVYAAMWSGNSGVTVFSY